MTVFQIFIGIVAVLLLVGVWGIGLSLSQHTEATCEKLDEVIDLLQTISEKKQ